MGCVTTGHVRLRRWCSAIAIVPLAACGTNRNDAEDRTILRPEQSEDFEIPADAVLVSLNGSLAKRVSSDSARAEYVAPASAAAKAPVGLPPAFGPRTDSWTLRRKRSTLV